MRQNVDSNVLPTVSAPNAVWIIALNMQLQTNIVSLDHGL